MSGYIHFTDEQKQRARGTDLVSFLRSRGQQIKRSGSEYEWAGHHITIRDNKWFDQYGQEGGTAIDFAMKELALAYPQAVQLLLGYSPYSLESDFGKSKDSGFKEKKQFVLPEANTNMRRVYAYLIKTRGIDRDAISYFAGKNLIYEDARHHNAVFVGRDNNGVPRHAHKKSTSMRDDKYRGNAAGSEAAYSFHYIGQSEKIFAFEAPVDMLSYITLMAMRKDPWQDHSYASLCSVSAKALIYQLSEHPHIKSPFICLDNDMAGRDAASRISRDLLALGYPDTKILTPSMKDWNEDLLLIKSEPDFADFNSDRSEAQPCMASPA